MENMKIDYKDNIVILSDITQINDTNYWEITRIERESVEKNIEFINIKVSIGDKKTIFFLMENGYTFKNREGNFYTLEKKCQNIKSLRLSLTKDCNYKCFFCHGEGSKMTDKREDKSRDEIYSLIKEAIKNNYTDITFTGGEPLLRSNDIIWYLNKLSTDKLKPYITIVTNGSLIEDKLLDTIENYVGDNKELFKFNFSMHSLKSDIYLGIVRPVIKAIPTDKESLLELVKKNIKKIKARNLIVKLNFVLLKDVNTSKKDIKEILDFAYENKVDYIKFLELLVTEDLIKQGIYKFYITLGSLLDEWKDELVFYKRTTRRDEYLYKGKTKVELQQCICMEGCAKCLINTSVFLTSESKYFPCFLKPEKVLEVNSAELISKIEEGTEYVKELGKEYGNGSPILVRNKEQIEEKEEYYYIPKKIFKKSEIEKILKDFSYEIVNKRNFEEKYIKPSSINNEDYLKKGKIYKFFENSEEKGFIESLQEIEYIEDNKKFLIKFLNKKIGYENKKIPKEKIQDYLDYLKDFNLEVFLELEWDTTLYKKGSHSISLGFVKSKLNNKEKIIFMSNQKFEDEKIIQKLELSVLEEAVLSYILK
ncbi:MULTISPECIES: radical SAM protein [Fusobacterium]|jgi:probable molybdenum cofactor biosynthesis protein A|uniref:Radical SAM protein n=1 Tax=Fusobacterium nucleatum subsp. polymorphum TaxID=76857 RepID=A0A2C6BPU6_FUSNP|nr:MULTISPECIES: radical SAM protein [Fusobacterium]EUB12553.1 radical SAM domain protein [Fusobacterium sp. CM22]PHI05855.1 radical SAM protein [Fusobacterium polymorphum]PHI08957.1 radical SAM protein [Fusobacterium polymorphum]